MSDFDEEAERERLREQFERDKQKREASERMSELLLKGATMTNRHCDNCGDPVFRYDGREFCPTCQQPTGQQGGQGAGAQSRQEQGQQRPPGRQQPAGEQQPPEGRQPREQDASPEPPAAADGRDPATADATPDRDAPEPSAETAGDDQSTDPTEHADPAARRPPATQRDASRSSDPAPDRRAEPSASADAPSSAGGLSEARESLVRTLTEMSRKAETTDDLARKREYLAAAREAAEALAATDRAS